MWITLLKVQENKGIINKIFSSISYHCTPRLLKSNNEYTNCFCLHKIGSILVMCRASRTCRWKLVLAKVSTVNISSLYFWPHSMLFTRCLPIADVGSTILGGFGLPRIAFKLRGTCCLIRACSLWDVLPTYLLSQQHVKRYTSWLRFGEGKTSLTEDGSIGLES